jgi:acyl carrier protein
MLVPPTADIEAIVRRHLEDITRIPRATIRGSDRIGRDLGADSDDLSFVFIPAVERELGVTVRHEMWRNIYTVQEACEALRQALLEHHQGA